MRIELGINSAEAIMSADLIDEKEEDDMDNAIEEVFAFLLVADSAVAAVISFNLSSDADDADKFPGADQIPATLGSTTRSGRVHRLSSRYHGRDWMCH